MPLKWSFLADLVNFIPIIATVVTSILSVLMAQATLRYAKAADKSLALAREEFEDCRAHTNGAVEETFNGHTFRAHFLK
jgi:hypothetical protein